MTFLANRGYVICLMLALMTVLRPSDTFGRDAARTRSERALQIGVGGHLLYTGQDITRREADDVIGTTPGMTMRGLQLSVHYLPVRWFGIGVLGSVDSQIDHSEVVCDPGDCTYTDHRFLIWRSAVEGRFYLRVGTRIGFWLALEAGIAAGVDVFEEIELGEAQGTRREGRGALDVGLGGGMDIRIVAGFFIGWEVRALLFAFGKQEDSQVSENLSDNLSNAAWPLFGFLTLGYSFSL